MYNVNTLKKPLIWLIIIIILASILRLYRLDLVPPALFGDEVDVGYQAYSLLKTGQDLRGNTWPVLVRSISEYRAPLFIYSDIPFVALFGLNEWGVRLAAVFWGILGILGFYLLTKKLFDEKVGILSAFLLAISPWHIQYSRAGFEVTMLLSFIIFGTFYFIKGLEKKHYLFLSAGFFALTPYIYSTAVVFMPLFLLALLIVYKKELLVNKKLLTAVFLCLFLILVPYTLQTLSGKAGERFNLISIFSNKDLTDKVTLLQQKEHPLNLQRVFHNKPTVLLQTFTMNYLQAFSPEFLFLRGDPNFRQSIHEMGQMYPYEIILLLLGLFWVLKNRLEKSQKLILFWLLLAPIPASLTYDGGFHATRNFLMLPPLIVLVSLGFLKLLNRPRLKYMVGALLIVAAFNFIFYLNRYFVDYPLESWKTWHYGFKEAILYINEESSKYDKFLINNTYEPTLIRFLFWTKYDPNEFHEKFKGDTLKKQVTFGFDGFLFDDKYYFGRVDGPFEKVADQRILFMSSAENDITNPDTLKDPRVKLLKTIYSPNGDPIFYIISGTGQNDKF